jgi:hypothetical protein
VLLGDLIYRTFSTGHIPNRLSCFICRLMDAVHEWHAAHADDTDPHTVERFLEARPWFQTDVTRLLLITPPREEES